MPNDAKFGLVVGVGLVITVAVVFFQKEGPADSTAALKQHRTVVTDKDVTANPSAPAENDYRSRNEIAEEGTGTLAVRRRAIQGQENAEGRRHVIEEGDTLFSLSRRYYGDGERFIDIYRANRDVIPDPDRLPVGTEIRIP